MLLHILSALFCFLLYSFFISYKVAAIIVLIIAIHEYGHYLSLLYYKAKDIKLYFIPFFGAVISGKELYNTFNQQIVSLAGPIVGIIFAVIFQFVFYLTNNIYIWLFAISLALINIVNLLPLGSSDGSQVLRTISISLSKKFGFIFYIFTVLLEFFIILISGVSCLFLAYYFHITVFYILPVASFIGAIYFLYYTYKNMEIDFNEATLSKKDSLILFLIYSITNIVGLITTYCLCSKYSIHQLINLLKY